MIKTRRPKCACCGKGYGSRWIIHDKLTWKDGQFPEAYDGPLNVIKEIYGVYYSSVGHWVGYRDLWDGKSFRVPYEPFCTLRCALDFARAAYKRGLRVI
jgi:hypothetical protein